jgi:hypothetical protein
MTTMQEQLRAVTDERNQLAADLAAAEEQNDALRREVAEARNQAD